MYEVQPRSTTAAALHASFLGTWTLFLYGIYQQSHSYMEMYCCNQRQWKTTPIHTFVPYFFYIFDVLLTKVSGKNILEACYV